MNKYISILLRMFIRIYQLVISPLFGTNCRFFPSCSHYADEAIKRFGFFRGMIKGFLRFLRCQPFCRGGYDPVSK